MQSGGLPQFISFCLYLHTYKFMRQKLSLSREKSLASVLLGSILYPGKTGGGEEAGGGEMTL